MILNAIDYNAQTPFDPPDAVGPSQAVQALRVLRALKPLRLLTRSAGMRLVFKSVVLSLGAMAHVSVLCIMFLLIFAILGVQLFSGRLYRCAPPATLSVRRPTCWSTPAYPCAAVNNQSYTSSLTISATSA